MNFLDAHKIVHDYGGSLSYPPDKDALLFRPQSLLKNSKDEIFDAFKIFLAHTIMFNTRTQEQLDTYISTLTCLNCFVADSKYWDAIKSKQTANPSGFHKLTINRNQQEEARQRYSNYLKESVNLLNSYRSDEMDDFIVNVINEADRVREKLKAKKLEKAELLDTFNDYCCFVYKHANIDIQENDVYYFRPFYYLRELIHDEDFSDLFKPYEEYLMNYES